MNSLTIRALAKCDIFLGGHIISNEKLLRAYADFLATTAEAEGHTVGFALHTGSILFDAMAIVYAAISNLVFNTTNSEDVISGLKIGDAVLYGTGKKTRSIFQGFAKLEDSPMGEYILLTGVAGKTYVPKSRWGHISPYHGTATRLDRRGLRQTNSERTHFFKDVLGFREENIPNVINSSTTIVLSRERADQLIKGITISFGDKRVCLLDIVTASYFTENEELYYGGNIGKTEPVLKITSKLSKARSLMMQSHGNTNIGLIVLGHDMIARGITELPALLNKRSIHYEFVCTHMDSEYVKPLLEIYDGVQLFACTKEKLKQYSIIPVSKNILTQELSAQALASLRHNVQSIPVGGYVCWDEYCLFKKTLQSIRFLDIESDEKNQFIIQAYYLMNLFTSAVFSMDKFEKYITSGVLSVEKPSKKLEVLSELSALFPERLNVKCKEIISILETCYLTIQEQCPKQDTLRDVIVQYATKQVALIVPKTYYETVLSAEGIYNLMTDPARLHISTPNKFKSSIVYDVVICVGDIKDGHFNPFRCRTSKDIYILQYLLEERFFKNKCIAAKNIETEYNQMMVRFSEYESSRNTEETLELVGEVAEVGEVSDELDAYVHYLNELATLKSCGLGASSSSTLTDTVAVALFESGERAFFTKRYKAYVIDESSSDVVERPADLLSEGDLLIFTQNNEIAQDIVDEILSELIRNKGVSLEISTCYAMSKKWKVALVDYMNISKVTPKKIAQIMIGNGVKVQEATIKQWLDADSRTIGPRLKDSIQQIALLVDDEEMFENYEKYFEACSTIRKIRREILKAIGEAIISKYRHAEPPPSALMEGIYARIDSLAVVLKIESISATDHKVPINAINRPISLKE